MPQIVGDCYYPTNMELVELQRDLMPRFEEGRLGLQILPYQEQDANRIQFRTPDNLRGRQGWRGLDKPLRQASGNYNYHGSRTEMLPGYWGEKSHITERELTEGMAPGTCGARIDLTDRVGEEQQWLMERRYNRIEANIWDALVYGHYEALDIDGSVMYEQSFPVREYAVSTPWSDITNSTPLDDFRQVKLLGEGTSADFGTCARAYMNQRTANCLYRNQNPNDVGKAGLSACCTFMGPDIVNQQFAAQGLPQITVYHGGDLDDDGNFHTYIPDGAVVIIGCRPGGARIGAYHLTANAVGCGVRSGFWQKIIDNCDRESPRMITIEDGHNGGPSLWYSRAVVVLKTGC